MPIVCDFTEIIGDNILNVSSQSQVLKFNTAGRLSGSQVARRALLIFNVRGLTSSSSNVPVRVNEVNVGSIFPYLGANGSHWYTQMISLDGSRLNNGDNRILLEAINDSFQVKNMVCFFHQSV